MVRSVLALVCGVCVVAASEPNEEAIRKRIDEVKRSERTAWKQIPWTASLLEARRLAEREKRPVFLFSHDGNIETGRC